MDEPTSFLDIRHKLDFLYLLRQLARERNIAVSLSLHELDLAQRFSDTVLCVRDGKVDRIGPPEEIFRGDYITELYGVEHGAYDPLFGGIETERVPGVPLVFVVGGGGSGIPVYRLLQRKGIPFAAGVLQESDLDFPVARALAAETFTVSAFAAISDLSIRQSIRCIQRCRYLICTVGSFGAVNGENQKLLRYAQERNMVLSIEELDRKL